MGVVFIIVWDLCLLFCGRLCLLLCGGYICYCVWGCVCYCVGIVFVVWGLYLLSTDFFFSLFMFNICIVGEGCLGFRLELHQAFFPI